MNSTIKAAAKVAEELNKSNENSDKNGRHSTHKSKIRRVLKKKNGKANYAWPVYQKYGQTAFQHIRHAYMAVDRKSERGD